LIARPARVLSIAGSDSGGGAGIQADIKTATALGAYAMTAITAVTAQNTLGVEAVFAVPPEIVRKQIIACLDDIGADAIKIGMLCSASVVETVAEVLRARAGGIPIVLDPVILSTSGTPLLDDDGVDVLRKKLIPLAAVVTPNIPEAALLTGFACNGDEAILRSGKALLAMGAKAALIKGGHANAEFLSDVLVVPNAFGTFDHAKLDTPHTHGTGCTLAAAIAVGLAQGRDIRQSVGRAHAFVQHAITTAPAFGHGCGPLNHMWQLRNDRADLDLWGSEMDHRSRCIAGLK